MRLYRQNILTSLNALFTNENKYDQSQNFNEDGFAQFIESLDWYELKNEEVVFLGENK